MRRGDRIELTLTDLSYLGGAVGRTPDNLAVFAVGGLPGERVVVEIDEQRRHYARGQVRSVEEPAPERTVPRCPHFGTCGGCQWQHLSYVAQVRWKTEMVRRQLQRVGRLAEPPVRPAIAAAQPWGYRNQARFSLDERGRLCFTRAQSHSLLPLETCHIVQPEIAALMPRLQGLLPNAHQLVVRYGARTGQWLLAPALPLPTEDLASGQAAYDEVLLGRTYRVSAPSFFQVNTRIDVDPQARRDPVPLSPALRDRWPDVDTGLLSQAEVLALLVQDRLELTGSELVVDAYCGVGTFALLLADQARRVIGIEEAYAAVADAKHNARGMDQMEFRLGRTEAVLADLAETPDAVVLDPSRLGCDPSVIAVLLDRRPSRIVYVSCDPATLARDLAALCTGGYHLREVQPLDMFPQTHHIETVSLLEAG